jgi:hypothetical protein
MGEQMVTININEALINPSAFFKTPEDVLKSDISLENQIKILELWEHDLHLLQTCDEENMAGPDLQLLRRIHDCLLKLRDQVDEG